VESPWPACDESVLRRIVQASFAQRRKTLRNNLKGIIDEGGLRALGIDPGARAETLELTQFIGIANAIGGREGAGAAHPATCGRP
jgi:16S rRNA (adenine1518-N6/adenine1519-N6)-dimethyltransferase